METCDVCGNEYDKPLRIEVGGRRHTFDCFECAISRLAPTCAHCGTRVIGHGMEKAGQIFCCAHCAASLGAHEMRDRA
jgi:hypothetical protein